MSHRVVVNLVEAGTTEITVSGQHILLTEIGGATTTIEDPEIVTLFSTGLTGDIAALADAAAASAAAALQSELNASNSELLQASENIFAGALVNIWESTGPKIRLANAALGRPAMGYILEAALTDETVRVYFDANNTMVTGLIPGPQFLSTASGLATNDPPDASGQIFQRVGFASRATNLNFQPADHITLA